MDSNKDAPESWVRKQSFQPCFSWEDLLNNDSFLENLMKKEEVIEEPKKEIEDKLAEEEIKIPEEKSKESKPQTLKTPICVVLGGVDNGKTSFLDALRGTQVQAKEAGRITQIISGTNIMKSEIECYFEKFKANKAFDISIPGILLIDTPGHESFVSLRKLGSKLCDIAIIIVDIKKGPDPGTITSLQLLQESETPFIIALNKIYTLYKWKSTPDCPFTISKKNQSENTLNHFDKLVQQNFIQFANVGVNAKLYTELKSFKDWNPMVPISAKTKEGFSDLIAVLVKMSEKILGFIDVKEEAKGIVIEKYDDVQGVGSAIDIILTHGKLKVYDTIYIGDQKIKIRNITAYNHVKQKKEKLDEISAAYSCTLYGTNIKEVVPGSTFSSKGFVKEEVVSQEEIDSIITAANSKNTDGIFIQADSMGSLLALSYLLKQNKIPVKNYAIGSIRDKHLTFVQQFGKPKLILGFNVNIDSNCDPNLLKGVSIYTEKVVFKLIDHYGAFMEEYREKIRKELMGMKQSVVWPCILAIEKDCVFNKTNPLIFAVKVKKGTLHLGTKLATFNFKEQEQSKKVRVEVNIGKVTSIRDTNEKDIDKAEKGKVVVIKVESDSNISFGRQLDEKNILYSRVSRESIDIMKEHFKEEIDADCVKLLVKLKKIFDIQ